MSRPLEALRERVWSPDLTVTVQQRAVLTVLVLHTDPAGLCWPGQERIAKRTGLSRRTVNYALKELEALGLIKRRSNPPASTRYTVHVLHSAPDARSTVQEMRSDCARDAHELPIELPRELPIHSEPDAFDVAWGLYPRRAGGNPKKPARKAWDNRIRQGASPEELTEGVKRYAEFVRATGREGTEYVKQGKTFFGPDGHWLEAYAIPIGREVSASPPSEQERARAAWAELNAEIEADIVRGEAA